MASALVPLIQREVPWRARDADGGGLGGNWMTIPSAMATTGL